MRVLRIAVLVGVVAWVMAAEPKPVVSVESSQVAVDEGGSVQVRFVRSATEGTLVLHLTSTIGTPGSASLSDLVGEIPPTVTFPAGEDQVSISVHAATDGTVEGLESFTVSIADDDAYTVASAKNTTIQIYDGTQVVTLPAPPTPPATRPQLSEGAGGVATATISVTPSLAVKTLTLALGGGTAIAGTATSSGPRDYNLSAIVTGTATSVDVAVSGTTATLVIPSLATAIDLRITPVDDLLAEDPETIVLAPGTLTGVGSGTVVGGPITIDLLDDEPTVTISRERNANEPSSEGRFRVSLPTGTVATTPLKVRYELVPEQTTAIPGVDFDFDLPPGEVTILSGNRSASFAVKPKQDALVEGAEVVAVRLKAFTGTSTERGYHAVGGIALMQLYDAAVVVGVDAATAKVSENSTSFAVARIGRSPGADDIPVVFRIGGTAGSADYDLIAVVTNDATSATITRLPDNERYQVVLPGESSGVDLRVKPRDDAVVEGAETVTITLQVSSEYALRTDAANATLTITDDDLVLAIAADHDAAEPSTRGAFRIVTSTSSGVSARDVVVRYGVSGGTAAEGADYTFAPARDPAHTLILAANARRADLEVVPVVDTAVEPDESVTVTLLPSDDYVILGDPTATLQLRESRGTVGVTASASEVVEGGAAVTVTASVSTATTSPLSLEYTVTGEATTTGDGADVSGVTGAITIPIGATSATFTITARQDHLVEETEHLTLTLKPQAGISIDPAHAAVALSIADRSPTASIAIDPSAATLSEDGRIARLLVSCTTAERSTPIEVTYAVTGTATSGTDFMPLVGTVQVPMEGPATIQLQALFDGVTDPDETVIITLTASQTGATYRVGTPASQQLTIVDVPAPSLQIVSEIDAPEVLTGATREIGVVVSKPADLPLARMHATVVASPNMPPLPAWVTVAAAADQPVEPTHARFVVRVAPPAVVPTASTPSFQHLRIHLTVAGDIDGDGSDDLTATQDLTLAVVTAGGTG